MSFDCTFCDPKYYVIYGFCRACGKRCEPPLWNPKSDVSHLDHLEMMTKWNMNRADLINDIIRRSEE